MRVELSFNMPPPADRFNPEEKAREGTLRQLLTRIRNARVSRLERDNLRRMVRDLAVNEQLDHKSVKNIIDMVFLCEMTATTNNGRSPKTFPPEKSVDDSIAEISALRAERRLQQDKLDSLRTSFSATA